MPRIVLNPFGSFGDLHPYLAMAIELKRRGHQPLIATSEVYRKKVEAEGIDFAAVRPDVGELMGNDAFLKLLWDPKNGTKYLLRDYLLPNAGKSYEDLAKACRGADLLITHFAAYAGPIVAEVQKLRWLSIALQPMIFLSKYDPPVLAPLPWARHFYGLGPWLFAGMLKIGELETRRWAKPLLDLREKLGLPCRESAILKGQYSPYGTLALFSKHFAQPQLDWPDPTIISGFISYDKPGEGFGFSPDTRALERFLDAGDPPVVFTLGSSAVMAAGQFFEESIKAAKKLGMRAVLLVGKNAGLPSDDSILVADYVPHSQLFPRAAATVHVGGIGTVGQALRAGRPMLVVPWAHDQPDNAHRCRRLGVAQTVQRHRYRAAIVARKLDKLLTDPDYGAKAEAIAQRLAGEDGLRVACDAVEDHVRGAVGGDRL